MSDIELLSNFVGGRWVRSSGEAFVDVHNPAHGTVIARTPLSTAGDVDAAVGCDHDQLGPAILLADFADDRNAGTVRQIVIDQDCVGLKLLVSPQR